MRKKILILVSLMLICTGCGSNKSDSAIQKSENMYDSYESGQYADEDMKYYQENDAGFGNNYSADNSDVYYDSNGENISETSAATFPEETTTDNSGNAEQVKNNTTDTIDKEMLVYRGELSVDTLDFNTSVSSFKAIINEKGGFIESESYTDNCSANSYYAIDKEYKHNVYNATVRVPSNTYDEVMNSATNLGDVRSKNSNATNVTQQYGTYKSQLEIYETEYNRYLTLLESATDDEYALMIENELFDIQIKIADLKSGISNIENDVAYSYIDITIKEVSKYEEAPEKTDTFFDRFKNTCKDSWEGFLNAMEELLFAVIMNIYGILILIVIIILIWRIWRKKRGKKSKKSNKGKLETTQKILDVEQNQTMENASKSETKKHDKKKQDKAEENSNSSQEN
ncbi:MAG: DUF4349 domain-containing protein [Coprococcus sp.]